MINISYLTNKKLRIFLCMVVSGISCPETILNKKSSRGDMSVRISHISKID
jgi:hypothetical protein